MPIRRCLGVLIGFLLWIGLICAASASSSAVVLDADLKSVRLAPHADYACGPDIAREDRFRPVNLRGVSLGFLRPRCEIRIALKNPVAAPRAVILSSDFNIIDRLEVLLLDARGQTLSRDVLGDNVPYSARRLKTRTLAVPLTLPAGSETRLVLRVDTTSTLYMPLLLSTPESYAERIAITDGLIGIVYGITLGLLLYHLLLWWQTRERVDMAYLGYVFLTLVFFGFEQGSFYRFWPESPDWNNVALYSASFLALAAGLNFARVYLRTAERPGAHRGLGGLILLLVVLAIAQPLLPTRLVAPAASGVALLVLLGLMALGAWRWRQGLPEGRFFLTAWGLLLLVGAIFVMMLLLGVPGIESLIICAQAAFAAQQVLLSYALAQRVRVLQASSQAHARESHVARAESAAKSEFLARMSHEIRTPINAMLGVSQLLEATGDPRQLAQLQILRQSGEQLLSLINDVLDYSKIEAGKLALEHVDFDLRALLQGAADLFRMQAAQKELRFGFHLPDDVPSRINGDPTRWRQVLYNLLANAVKFTDRGDIALEAEYLPAESGQPPLCVLRIRDTGIGMTEEQLAQLFTSFHQADPSITRRYGGTGLGLAISKQLTALMGGHLTAVSLPGHGTEFRLELPCPPPSADAQATETHPPRAGLAALRVLVCEDHPVNQTIIAAMLARLGVTDYALVENGRLGVDRICAEPDRWDVVLMDCEMPVLDGFSAVRELRAREREAGRPPLPVIALTAHVMPDYRVRCREAGMNGFLGKPVILSELARRLAEFAPG